MHMNTQRTTVLSFLYAFFICFGSTLLLKGCTAAPTEGSKYLIAYDPSWFPLELDSSLQEIGAFSEDIVDEIGQLAGLRFAPVRSQWDQMPMRLRRGDYQAILTGLSPDSRTRRNYIFSEPYLRLGPVILAPYRSGVRSLDDLSKKRVAVDRARPRDLEFLRAPGVRIVTYDELSQAVVDMVGGKLDAIIMNGLQARAFETGLYKGRVAIVSERLTDEALRLAVLKHGNYESLVEIFDKNLALLREGSEYRALIEKWDLDK